MSFLDLTLVFSGFVPTTVFFIMKCLIVASAFAAFSYALGIPKENNLLPRASCEHIASARSRWGDFDIDTDYSTVVPDIGVTREVRRSLKLA